MAGSSVLPMQEHREQFIDYTLKVWQARTSSRLSREDARQIIQNISGFFQILSEWEEALAQAYLPPAAESSAAYRAKARGWK